MGTAEDSLWSEATTVREDERYQMIIERAPYDPAGKTVPVECPACGLQYMSLVRIGVSATTLYTCSCGVLLDSSMKKIERTS
jgi:hypothetical protein